MAIVRLRPDEVGKQWDAMKRAIKATVPEYVRESEARMTSIFTMIMGGLMDCWIIRNDQKLFAMLMTTFTEDPAGDKSLCVYSLFGYETLTKNVWEDIGVELIDWARQNGCMTITAYTTSESMVKLLRKYNSVEQTFVTIFL